MQPFVQALLSLTVALLQCPSKDAQPFLQPLARPTRHRAADLARLGWDENALGCFCWKVFFGMAFSEFPRVVAAFRDFWHD